MAKQEPVFTPLQEWVLAAHNRPGVRWLFNPFVPAQGAVLFSGLPKTSFKSWFAFQLCMSYATGQQCALLKPEKSGRCWILEEEGPEKSTAMRFDMLERGSGIRVADCNENILFSHRKHLLVDNSAHLDFICKTVRERQIELVVIDTMAKSSQADENKAHEMSHVMGRIDLIRDAGAAVVYLHHLRKPAKDTSEDIDTDIRGSGVFTGYYDVHLAFRRRRATQAHIDLTVRSRDAEEQYYAVTWWMEKDTEAKLQMAVVKPGEVTEELLDDLRLRLMPKHGYGIRALKTTWGEPDKDIFDATLALMVERDWLYKKGAKYFAVPVGPQADKQQTQEVSDGTED